MTRSLFEPATSRSTCTSAFDARVKFHAYNSESGASSNSFSPKSPPLCTEGDSADRIQSLILLSLNLVDNPRRDKTGLREFRPGLTQTGLCCHRRRLEV